MINQFLIDAGEDQEDPKYIRLQMRIENTRHQLRLEDKLEKLRLAKRTAPRISYDYGDSDSNSDSDSDSDSNLFVSKAGRSKTSGRRDESRRLTGRQTEKPRVKGRMQLDHRGKTKEKPRNEQQNTLGSHEVVNRDELQTRMNQIMQQNQTM
jgi:hypothetical protein